MRLPTGTPTTSFTVFLSSGDDALTLRNLADALVRDGVGAVQLGLRLPVRFEVDRWERTAPHRLRPGESANAEFVARAETAQLVLGFLIEELGEGTREELEAVLGDDDIELSVLWCVDRDNWPDTPVGRWLHPRKNQLLIERVGPPDTDGPTVGIVRVLLEAVLRALDQHHGGEVLRERR